MSSAATRRPHTRGDADPPRVAALGGACACVLLLWLPVALGGHERVCAVDMRSASTYGYCGPMLADILMRSCKDTGYQGVVRRKKPFVVNLPRYRRRASHFLTKEDAFSYLGKRRDHWHRAHYQSGIVCECCRNLCSMSELAQYCAAAPDITPLVKRLKAFPWIPAAPRRLTSPRRYDDAVDDGRSSNDAKLFDVTPNENEATQNGYDLIENTGADDAGYD